MKITQILYFDCTSIDKDSCYNGDCIGRVDYHNGLLIPSIGSMMRFQSGKYDGFYKVVNHIYFEEYELLRINLEKV